jgi:Phage integrase family
VTGRRPSMTTLNGTSDRRCSQDTTDEGWSLRNRPSDWGCWTSESISSNPPGSQCGLWSAGGGPARQVSEAGDMIRRSKFGTMWPRATKSVGLGGLHFHDLRHYYASLLIRHGESVKTVQARLVTRMQPKLWTRTATSGRTLTTALVRRWIRSWRVFLRTPCGLRPSPECSVAGQEPISG